MSQTTNDTALGGAFGGDDEGLVQTNPEVEASQNPTTTKTITDENALGGSFGSEESPLAQSLSGEAQSSADAAQASEEAALASEQAAATSEANAATSASNAAQSSTEAYTSATEAATSEINANTSAVTATTKANEASASATQAAISAANASTSETNAATSEANAAQSELDAEASATSSTASALESQSSATSASSSASAASTSSTNAATSETNAATSATEASGSATDAANSATSAATSATNAANSASSAATSETNASTSETNAATSATSASTSETNAANSATNAATSETNAATSATNASTSETNAATSETNAATSATSAATSATNSATSETNAATSAATATSKASEAATSEANAATSATNAATSETNAATSATSASTSETNAATSETNAATSETNASASATSASNSATAAATSETNAATSATSAETAKVDAETAETNAATSATNAATSETNAATSATNAATSATESATSATASATSATASATSATESATSASNAAVSEANAIGGASDASVSATQAAGSATSAANSANAASTSETNAANSASAASTSEANAATSEANAATSATNASTSASTATTKASEASTSASNAASSETAAASSATAAASSATAAANSASNASASATSASNTLDQFEDIYLGAKASNPTLDNDGDVLQVGALYFNTTDNDLRIWEGSAWTNVVVSSDIQAQIDTSIANLVDSAPTALDTLNELAAALGDDPNFAATVNNTLGSLQNQITTLDNNKYEEGDSASFSDVSLDNMFGPISYDSNEGTLSFPISDSTTIHLGHEMAYMVKNTSGVSINKGDILAITGTDSGTVTVAKYLADGTFLAGQVVGIANETILNNETGYALTQGHVVGIDTSSYVEGAFLYASPTVAGGLTNVPPVSPNIKVIVGMCTVSDATNGEIVSRITFSQNASETNYSNTTSGLVASNVQGALDELQQNKASVDLLSSNINLFPTTAASTITGYNRLVTDKTDSDYNTTAVAVATGPIGLTETNVGQLASDAGLIDGSIAGITVTLIGNIEKTVGNSNQGAHFYFKIFRRESDGTEHEMGESNRTSVIYETDGYEQFSASVYLNDGGLSTFTDTDRIVLKFYGVSISGDPEYNFQFGGQAPVRCLVPVPVSVIPTSSAEETPVTVTSFNGILGSSDTNVQAALDTIDDHNHNTDYAPLAGYNSTNWNTAYGWGDHSTVGYLTSIPSEYLTQAEGDVRYLSIDATTLPDQTGHSGQFLTTNGTTADWATVDTSLGDTAYGWGDHSLAGYSTTDTTYSIGDGGLTEKNFTTALKTKLDGIATNANNYVLPFTNNSANWNTAYGWGDHALAGYLTSLPSHNHNDLYYTESEADSRFVNTAGDTMTGTLTVPNLTIGSGSKIKFANNDYIRYDDGVNRFHFDVDGGTSNASVQASTFVGALSGNASTASRWTNARTNTVTLTGDASGSGSASVDGTGNWTVSVPVVVNNDSHSHSNYVTTNTDQIVTGAKELISTANHYSGHFYYDAYDTNGNHYPHFLDGSGSTGVRVNWRIYNGGSLRLNTWDYNYNDFHTNVRAPIFYDSNNTGYYGDFASTSRMNVVNANSLQMNGTTVIDSSRNFSGVNLSLSGKATIWTNDDAPLVLRQGQSGHPWNYIEFRDSGNNRNWYVGTSTSGNMEIQGETGATGGVNTNKYFNSIQGFKVGGATVIDDSRNLTNINSARDNKGGYYQSAYHSGSDFTNGTLVQTDIPATAASGASYVIEVTGKSYSGNPPFAFKAQGYLYNSTIINHSGVNYGDWRLTYIKAMEYNGNLCFWWPRISYWNSFQVHVRDAGGDGVNRVTSVGNSTEPSVTKKVQTNLVQPAIYDVNITGKSLYANTFYGSDDTGYYVDPNGTSVLGKIWCKGSGVNSAPRFDTSFHVAQSQHFYGHSSGQTMYIGEANTVNIRSHGIASSSFRAPIFYDSNDTGRYLDPVSDSRLNKVRLYNRLSIGSNSLPYEDTGTGEAGVWLSGSATNATWFLGLQTASSSAPLRFYAGADRFTFTRDGHGTASGSYRAPIFYDSASTGYYLDAASNSSLNQIRTAGHISVGTHSDGAASTVTTSAVITFGSLSTDAINNYSIQTRKENYGGNYNKLDLSFHTGIRLGAHPNYGGVRFFSDQTMGTEIASIGKSGDYILGNNSVRSPIFYDSNDTAFYVDPAAGSRVNELYAYGGVRGRIAIGTSTFLDTYDSSRPALLLSGGQYPHLTLDSRTGATNENHGGVISFVSAISGGGYRRWSIGTGSLNGQVLSIGNRDNDNNPHLGTGGDTLGESTWGSLFWLDRSGNLQTSGSMRSPIFYDSNNTGFYTDPASTSNTNVMKAYEYRGNGNVAGTGEATYHPAGIYSTSNNWLYGTMYRNGSSTYYGGGSQYQVNRIECTQNYGEGVYGVYSASRLQHLWSMGTAYKLAANGTTSGNMYGIAWSHPNAGTIGGANNLASHGMLILENGVFKGAWGGGRLVTTNDIRGTLFYDYNNTGYYTDPASTSRTNLITTNKIHCVGSATNTAPRWDTSFHVAQSQHFYGHSAYGNIYVGESNDVQIRSTGIASSSFKAPIFYDSNDTSCFINPNSDSLFKGSLDIQENVSSPGYTFMEFLAYNTGGRLGSIYRQYGTMYYSTSSDYRLKENVVVLDNASEKLKLLKPKRFNFIDYPESTIDGFIAHEVEAIVPEAVIGEKDAVDRYGNPEYQSMDHSKLVPLLTAALQEALDKIEALETRLDVLENN